MPNLSYFGIIEFPGSRTPLDFGVTAVVGVHSIGDVASFGTELTLHKLLL